MASRLRAQILGLQTTFNNDQSGNAVVTRSLVIDSSSNIPALKLTNSTNPLDKKTASISVDLSTNLLLDSTTIQMTNKKLFEDKWSFPYPLGPYHVDAIPMQIKDKFKMSKYSLNLETDVSGGLVIEANGYKTVAEYDTPSALDVIVYVPSSRTSRIMTPIFKQDVSSNTNNPGTFNMPLIDLAISGIYSSDTFGDSLWAKINAYKLNCENTTDPSGLRPGLLNAVLSDPEYQLIQQNLKYPFKFWDVSSNTSSFIYDNLVDLSGNALQNILVDSSKYTTKITRSTWESQAVDASGVPIGLQGLSSNVNAQNRKMGVLFYWSGTGNAPTPRFHWEAALAASFGYVVVIGNGFPVTGHSFSKLGHTKRTFASLLADKTIPQIVKSEAAVSDLDNASYFYQAVAYGNGLANGLDGVGSYSRAQGQFAPTLPEIGYLYERYFYQIICILKKLKLYDFIDFNSAVPFGLSAGGQCLVHCHRLLTQNTTPNQGIATQFVLNDASGNPTSTKPFLFKSRAMIGHQPALFDISKTKNTSLNRRFLAINNRYSLGLDNFTVPTVIITGDYDYWKIFGSIVPQNFFNTMYQTLFQATSKIDTTAANNVMAASAIVYSASASHTENPSPYVAGNPDDGLLGTTYSLGFSSSWNKGWELPLNVSFPNVDSILEYGLASELAYSQLSALKVAVAYQVLIHRFLGADYPVPVQALSNLGLRVDIGPTHCDILTQPSFLRVGPVSEINYDASYNLTISAPALKLVNRQTTAGVATDSTSASLSVDASQNLVSDVKSIVLNQDINTISFVNPLPSRGDVASIKYIGIVNPGDISSTLPVLNGPAQPVRVYRIAYYSSNPSLSNSAELVSGTMYIPQVITKSTIIESGRGATIATNDNDACGWLALTSSKWVGRTAAQRSTGLSSLAAQVNISSLGYVLIAADGFGLGLSLNKVNLFNDYFGNINPSVDIIRAFRRYLNYTKSIGSNLFQNVFTSNILNIFHVGYSRGGLIGTGVVNELKPGVSMTIPIEEAQQFNSRKIILGATPMPKVYYEWLATNESNPATRYLNPTIAQLNALLLSGQTSGYDLLTSNFKKNILPLFADDVTRTTDEFLFGENNIFQRYKYDYYSNLTDMSNNGVLPPVDVSLGPGLNAVAVDWKQIVKDVAGFKSLSVITSNALPLNSQVRNLRDLSGTPIVHIYSLQDELCVPTGTGVDMSIDMATSNLGPDVNGPLDASGNPIVIFRGANKTSSYVNVTGGDLAIDPVTGTEAQMIGGIITMNNNQFINFGVNASGLPASLQGHSGFGAIWSNYVYLILSQHP